MTSDKKFIVKEIGKLEKYWKSWTYSELGEKERVRAWLERGSKRQTPAAQGVSLVERNCPPGLQGYHFLKTLLNKMKLL